MNKYIIMMCVVPIVAGFLSAAVGQIFPTPNKIIPLSSMLIIEIGFFYSGMLFGYVISQRNNENKNSEVIKEMR